MPPELLQLLAKLFTPAQPEQVPTLDPVYAAPPAEPLLQDFNAQQLPPRLAQSLRSPFVQDTLKPWLDVDPTVGTYTAPPGELGAMYLSQPNRVGVSQEALANPAHDVDRVLTHEFTHVASTNRDNEVGMLDYLMEDSAKAIPQGRKDLLRSAGNPEEMKAYAIEAALDAMRRGVKSSSEIPELVRYANPGVDAAFDWLLRRAEAVK